MYYHTSGPSVILILVLCNLYSKKQYIGGVFVERKNELLTGLPPI